MAQVQYILLDMCYTKWTARLDDSLSITQRTGPRRIMNTTSNSGTVLMNTSGCGLGQDRAPESCLQRPFTAGTDLCFVRLL